LYFRDRDVPELGIYDDLDDDESVRRRLEQIVSARTDMMKDFDDKEKLKSKKTVKRFSIFDLESGAETHYVNKEQQVQIESNKIQAFLDGHLRKEK